MNKLTNILKDFEPSFPSKHLPQEQALDYTAWLLSVGLCSKNNVTSEAEAEKIFNNMKAEVERYGVSPHYVCKRQLNSLVEMYNEKEHTFSIDTFPAIFANITDNHLGEDLGKRLAIYEKLVYGIMEKWYQNNPVLPDDIIHATCTGYLSPSPIQKLLSKKSWNDITITHSYQMGCYGAVPPLRMAVGFLASSYSTLRRPKTKVDILHTEYSSLHFQAINSLPDQIVTMTLFGDGFIKYSLCAQDEKDISGPGLRVLAAQDRLVASSLEEMTLIPGAHAFEMWLSKNVPLKIRDEIQPYIVALCKQVGIDYAEYKDKLIYALHPGGPKILDHIRDHLGIDESQIRFSRKVLHEHGNMVSATLPHIWKEVIDDPSVPVGTKVVSIAYGPGITMAGFMLEKV